MINDKLIRTLFIPLLGIVIPLVSGFYQYATASFTEIIITNCYSIFISFCVWHGGSWIIYKCRLLLPYNAVIKIATLCFLTVLYAAIVATILSGVWLFFTKAHHIDWQILIRNTTAVCIAVIVFTLIYEILFLSSENEIEHTKTKQLDTALTRAQLTVLKNELDPHFMYNSLNTLSWLIQKDSKKADDFIAKLSEVYRYFLVNKSNEQVTLAEEITFIKKYFSLLQLRYENKIALTIDLKDYNTKEITILPCALQLLVENAIKHNVFSAAEPLCIKVAINNENIYVVNTKRPGKIPHYSTKLGLSNLKERYQLVCKQPVTVESGRDYFMVSLPMLQSA
jgi:two-component system, LytTR family, sensor kinase